MSDVHLKSKKKEGYWRIYILGVVFFTFISICFLINSSEKNSKYICLFLSLICFIIAIICFWRLTSIKRFTIIKNELIQISFFGKIETKYNLNEIERWTEKQYKGKTGTFETTTLYTKTGKRIKLSSDNYSNYYELKDEITKDKLRDLKTERLNTRRFHLKGAAIIMILGVLFCKSTYNSLTLKDINSNNIIVFDDEISSIKYINSKHDYISINLKNYPDLNFVISGSTLKATFIEDLLNDMHRGDLISLGIDEIDYKKKIVKTDSLSFSDKFFFNENISVESAKSTKAYYLELSNNNIQRQDRKFFDVLLFGLFGFVFTVGGIYGIVNNLTEEY